jgi:hypothetical protein
MNRVISGLSDVPFERFMQEVEGIENSNTSTRVVKTNIVNVEGRTR